MQGHGQEPGQSGARVEPGSHRLPWATVGATSWTAPVPLELLPMSRLVPVLAVLCFALGLESSGATVSSVPKPARGSWVVDTTRTLDATTRAEVDRLGAEAHSSGEGQLVVVVVDTTQKVPARTFAQKLFNTWGIGKAGRDDGALLFIALKDRKAELLLGDGLSTPEDVSRSKALMSDHIIPAFKRGKPKEAVVEGAKGLRELLALSPLNARTSDVEAPPVQEAPPQPAVVAQPQVVAQPAVQDAPVEEEERGPGVLNWVLFGAGAFGLGWVMRGWWRPRKSKHRGGHTNVELNLEHGDQHNHRDQHEHRDDRDHAATHHPESERSHVATAVAVGATAVAVASVIEASSSSDSSSSSWDSSSSSSDSSSSWDSASSSSSSDFGGGDSSGSGSSGEW